jgi:hypothetical protein
VRELMPDGVDAALELVGCSVLADTLRTVRRHGTVCFTGALAGQWTIPDFSPFMIPGGVRLTSYAGEAADLPADVLANQLQAIAEGRLNVPVAKVYHGLEQVRDAQADLESGTTPGKHVVVLDEPAAATIDGAYRQIEQLGPGHRPRGAGRMVRPRYEVRDSRHGQAGRQPPREPELLLGAGCQPLLLGDLLDLRRTDRIPV